MNRFPWSAWDLDAGAAACRAARHGAKQELICNTRVSCLMPPPFLVHRDTLVEGCWSRACTSDGRAVASVKWDAQLHE